MPNIPLKEADVGMTLAKDAVNAQQMLLLKKGAALTDKHLRMLKSWGVEVVCVQTAGEGHLTSPPVPESHNEIEKEMALRFGDTIEDPVMAEVFRASSLILLERNRMS